MHFEKIIIIGSGKIASYCSNFLFEANIYHEVIETNDSLLSTLKYDCSRKNIKVSFLRDYVDIDDAILSNSKVNTLVISANNTHIFKKSLLTDITIINFHYGLLPKYRGMNIPSWVIFNEEKYYGGTWHLVNSKIDDGQVILQKKRPLTTKDTALTVTKNTISLGEDMFKEFILNFIEAPEQFIYKQKKFYITDRLYLKNQLPLNGVLSLELPVKKILNALKAFDYGPIEYIPKLKIELEGVLYKIKSYSFCKSGINKSPLPYSQNEYIFEKEGYTIHLFLE
ncbi:MAG: hypothetical protein MSA18_07035 [Succinivibrio sp.]|nr:hypothetical protein [Succinivibrio sp.]